MHHLLLSRPFLWRKLRPGSPLRGHSLASLRRGLIVARVRVEVHQGPVTTAI